MGAIRDLRGTIARLEKELEWERKHYGRGDSRTRKTDDEVKGAIAWLQKAEEAHRKNLISWAKGYVKNKYARELTKEEYDHFINYMNSGWNRDIEAESMNNAWIEKWWEQRVEKIPRIIYQAKDIREDPAIPTIVDDEINQTEAIPETPKPAIEEKIEPTNKKPDITAEKKGLVGEVIDPQKLLNEMKKAEMEARQAKKPQHVIISGVEGI